MQDYAIFPIINFDGTNCYRIYRYPKPYEESDCMYLVCELETNADAEKYLELLREKDKLSEELQEYKLNKGDVQ